MAIEALFNRDNHEGPTRTGFMMPDTANILNACFLQPFKQRHRAGEAAFEQMRMRWLLARGASQNRIVPMVYFFNFEDRVLLGVTSIVTSPLTERTFHAGLVGILIALDHDFRIGRERKSVIAGDQINRLAGKTALEGKLFNVIRNSHPSGEEMGRINTNNDRYRARLALSKILGALDVALFAIRAHDAQGLAVMHHAAIGTGVDAAIIEVAGDNTTGSSDIAATIELMMNRHRDQLLNINIIAGDNVFHDRTIIDKTRWDRFMIEHLFAIGLEKREPVIFQLGIHANRKRQAIRRRQHAIEATEAFGIAWNLIKQNSSGFLDTLTIEHLDNSAHFLVPMRAVYFFKLAVFFAGCEKVAQICLRAKILSSTVHFSSPLLIKLGF